ncbi:hypothetical protein NDU88_009752 [Pleurodeles waltl]|uniref:Endonuclease/exonuclease/phosphatase domain-containing protein n=1 Tax=Pleurodeles waltl TaxID=8319 RepID=A0AAV7QYE5_PLEWA|nr:hypothetical protein NDU88_009752 [Pleurodeles waltl]
MRGRGRRAGPGASIRAAGRSALPDPPLTGVRCGAGLAQNLSEERALRRTSPLAVQLGCAGGTYPSVPAMPRLRRWEADSLSNTSNVLMPSIRCLQRLPLPRPCRRGGPLGEFPQSSYVVLAPQCPSESDSTGATASSRRGDRSGSGASGVPQQTSGPLMAATPCADVPAPGRQLPARLYRAPTEHDGILFYRPPGLISNFCTSLADMFPPVDLRYANFVVVGDFNMHFDELGCTAATALLADPERLQLHQFVTAPTHLLGQ